MGVDATDMGGWTGLMYSCQNGHELCSRVLLEANAAVDATNEEGYTALMLSCQYGHELCTRIMLENGASLHNVSKDNFTMLMAASIGGLPWMVEHVLPHSLINATVTTTHA